MSPATTSASTLVRVTVAFGNRRLDLALPGVVPVAELIPELARSVGALAPGAVHDGYRLVTVAGRVLATDAGLVSQGVEDGGLLTLTSEVVDETPRVYDDVVEAIADTVERVRPWTPAAGRRVALVAACLMSVLGAMALLGQRGSPLVGVFAVLIAAVLMAAAIVLSWLRCELAISVLLAWLGTTYAAVAGPLLVAGGTVPGSPIPVAATVVLVVALVGLLGLAGGRALLLPPVVAAAVFLLAGLAFERVDVEPAAVVTVVLALMVIVGGAFPWLALGVTGLRLDDPGPVDPDRVATDAHVAREIMLALSASVGLLLVLVAPVAVSLGVPGAVLAGVCCVVVMLRTRRHRAASEVAVGLVSGLAGLLAAAVAALWLHPDWRAEVAALLVVSGAGLFAVTLSASGSVRRARAAQILETVLLLTLPSLTVVAVGLFPITWG